MDPEEANSPGAENTEAVQEARVEGASNDHNPQMDSTATGYADAYDLYRELGWAGVLPLKRGTKYPPPSGFTGKGKPDPSPDQTGTPGRRAVHDIDKITQKEASG